MLRDGLEYLRLAPAGFDAEVTQNVVMWGLPPVERLIEDRLHQIWSRAVEFAQRSPRPIHTCDHGGQHILGV